ncbi:hypothetical protein [uncultured Psychrobacter sp.]|uniref:hypothetical protein n=1 Tax=uncultured Psychrobacter sp. TaxID=259303 RepID=UPI002633D528|nr:hypothetical protein [uncultured Psychrobacter sp.]
MDFRSETKEQHFLSQVEQRFNSINRNANKENQRIYSFSLKNRDSYIVSMDSKKGINISNNLQILHLFSFDVLEECAYRYNFENLFESYESRIRDNTNSLIVKLKNNEDDIKSEVINIFRSKILNSIRNPYSIEKNLNTFSDIKGLHPTDDVHFKNFNRVLKGKNPQQNYICKILGITEKNYRDWLATLFMLLNLMEEEKVSFLDQVITRIFENKILDTRVYIYTYDEKSCLLSDRGFNLYEEGNKMIWDFNLCSNIFVTYCFIDIESSDLNIEEDILNYLKTKPKEIIIDIRNNDLRALEQYNKRTVSFCHKQVFGASKEYQGVKVSS